MAILAIDNEIEIELTHECNWNCPYCAIRTHTLPKISFNDIKNKLNTLVPNNSYITLSGGEPGMMSEKEILYVINVLKHKKCIINLNTNGLFIKKYEKLLYIFNEIIYHCSENLDINDIILNVNHSNVRYMIIVNDNNFYKLDKFLKLHNRKFDIIQATYNDNVGIGLSKQNRNMLITKYAKYMTHESLYRIFHEKQWNKMRFI